MKELGEYLRQSRIEKGISLKDIQETTKVRALYLEAIENGEIDKIPGEVYRKGFLVNYANAIGLDGQEVLQRYNQIKQQLDKKRAEAANEADGTAAKPKFNLLSSFKRYCKVLIPLVIVLLVALSFIYVPLMRPTPVTDEVVNLEQVDITSEPEVETPDENLVEPESTPVVTVPDDFTLSAKFSGVVWMDVKIDGKSLYGESGFTFKPTSPIQNWVAKEKIELHIGNLGGVEFSLNDENLGKLGAKGAVNKFVITAEGIQAP